MSVSHACPLHLQQPFTLKFPDNKKVPTKKLFSLGGGTYKHIDEVSYKTHGHKKVCALATPKIEPHQIKFECDISQKLRKKHVPNILKMKPVTVKTAKHEKQPGAIMESCRGKDLEFYLQHHDVPAPVRGQLAKQLVGAVVGMHKRKMCHLDLKMTNVFVSLDGQQPKIRLGDFGEVQPIHKVLTYAVGTYPAPEFRWAQDMHAAILVEPALDLYPLGRMLYRILHGKSSLDTLDMSWGDKSTPIRFQATARTVHQTVLDRLGISRDPRDHCICQMLAVNPADRPSSNQIQEAFHLG